jgi:hypothetical protein
MTTKKLKKSTTKRPKKSTTKRPKKSTTKRPKKSTTKRPKKSTTKRPKKSTTKKYTTKKYTTKRPTTRPTTIVTTRPTSIIQPTPVPTSNLPIVDYSESYESYEQNDNDNCNFNPDNSKIKIIHITDSPFIFNNTDYIEYTYTTNININLFNDCKTKNIYIYIDQIRDYDIIIQQDIIKQINELLKNNNVKKYKDVNIINIVKSYNYIKNLIHFEKNFRKIINIRKYHSNYNSFIMDEFYNKTNYNITYDDNIVFDNNKLLFYIKSSIIENTESNFLIDQYFYKAIVSIPICAFGRLAQASGTCWLNSIINSIILVPYFRKKIIKIIKNDKTFEKLQNLEYVDIKSAFDFKYALLILFNNLLLKQNKAQPSNGNFIADLSSRLLSIIKTGSEKTYKKLKKENYNKALEYGDSGAIYDDMKATLNLILKIFFEFNEIKFYGQNVPQNFNITDTKQHNIIVLYLPYNKKAYLNNDLIINNVKYVIQSGILHLPKESHIIAGLICNDVPYIYDANNYLSFDNWVKYESKNYKIKQQINHHNDISDIDSIYYAIYIRENLVKQL